MAAETRRETAEMRKRKDKRRIMVKSGVVRNESGGGRREGGEGKIAQHETAYMCDRRLTADETYSRQQLFEPHMQNLSMPALQDIGNGFPIEKVSGERQCRSIVHSIQVES